MSHEYTVRVQPRARRNQVTTRPDGTLQVATTAPALSGRANQAVIDLLADHFHVRPSQVILVSGLQSKNKRVQILSS